MTRHSLGDLDLEAHLRDAARKQRFVTPMFEIIAPRYDAFTRLFSLGMDAGWKTELLEMARGSVPSGARVLDVGCGTGDLALGLAAPASGIGPGRPAPAVAIGVDAAMGMVERAEARRRRRAVSRAAFVVGDLMALPVPDASVDAVTAGYALRNAPALRPALGELSRVLRPGGHLFTLDFYQAPNAVWRRLVLAYLRAAGNAVGWLWHREPVVYGYIAHSIVHFVTPDRFGIELEAAGFRLVRVRPHLGGAICLHHAIKVA